MRVQQDQRGHPQVPNESEEVNEGEDYKERNLQLWVIYQSPEDECGDCCMVSHS